MAPCIFKLITLREDMTAAKLFSTIQSLHHAQQPIYIGKPQHWFHEPTISADQLLGVGGGARKWDYLLIYRYDSQELARLLYAFIERDWFVIADVPDAMINEYPESQRTREAATIPPLPQGWSPQDTTALDAAIIPDDLSATLGLESHPLGSAGDSQAVPIPFKDFVRDFGKRHVGAVNMFNLLAYVPGQRARYAEYRTAFAKSVGSTFGGQAMVVGMEAVDWSSKVADTADGEVGWESTALIHYPSIWHFAAMLDSEGYKDADRRYKGGVLRDNPILCCVGVDITAE